MEVQHKNTWWECYSINDVEVSEILSHAKDTYGNSAFDKVASSLAEVLASMDPPRQLGATVKLELVDLQTAEIKEFPKVPCTAENYATLMKWKETNNEDWSTPEAPKEEEEVDEEEEAEGEDDDEEEGAEGGDESKEKGAKKKKKSAKHDGEDGEGGEAQGRKEDSEHDGDHPRASKEDKLESLAAAFHSIRRMASVMGLKPSEIEAAYRMSAQDSDNMAENMMEEMARDMAGMGGMPGMHEMPRGAQCAHQ